MDSGQSVSLVKRFSIGQLFTGTPCLLKSSIAPHQSPPHEHSWPSGNVLRPTMCEYRNRALAISRTQNWSYSIGGAPIGGVMIMQPRECGRFIQARKPSRTSLIFKRPFFPKEQTISNSCARQGAISINSRTRAPGDMSSELMGQWDHQGWCWFTGYRETSALSIFLKHFQSPKSRTNYELVPHSLHPTVGGFSKLPAFGFLME